MSYITLMIAFLLSISITNGDNNYKKTCKYFAEPGYPNSELYDEFNSNYTYTINAGLYGLNFCNFDMNQNSNNGGFSWKYECCHNDDIVCIYLYEGSTRCDTANPFQIQLSKSDVGTKSSGFNCHGNDCILSYSYHKNIGYNDSCKLASDSYSTVGLLNGGCTKTENSNTYIEYTCDPSNSTYFEMTSFDDPECLNRANIHSGHSIFKEGTCSNNTDFGYDGIECTGMMVETSDYPSFGDQYGYYGFDISSTLTLSFDNDDTPRTVFIVYTSIAFLMFIIYHILLLRCNLRQTFNYRIYIKYQSVGYIIILLAILQFLLCWIILGLSFDNKESTEIVLCVFITEIGFDFELLFYSLPLLQSTANLYTELRDAKRRYFLVMGGTALLQILIHALLLLIRPDIVVIWLFHFSAQCFSEILLVLILLKIMKAFYIEQKYNDQHGSGALLLARNALKGIRYQIFKISVTLICIFGSGIYQIYTTNEYTLVACSKTMGIMALWFVLTIFDEAIRSKLC